jgi:hypothetical protein
MEHDGTLALLADGSAMDFTRDQVFASPSAAAACVLGRTSNGRTEWRVDNSSLTFGEWQESLLGVGNDATPEQE